MSGDESVLAVKGWGAGAVEMGLCGLDGESEAWL